MDFKIELIFVPVTDVDRAKAFYVDRVGFVADFDNVVNDDIRFVQLTPVGSACSIAFGTGITDMESGSQRGIQVVIDDADAWFERLTASGVHPTAVQELAWGRFVTFDDPDGNRWTLQQLPQRS
jgi:uncharacterized glyoxalase superfamily protein PhnB